MRLPQGDALVPTLRVGMPALDALRLGPKLVRNSCFGRATRSVAAMRSHAERGNEGGNLQSLIIQDMSEFPQVEVSSGQDADNSFSGESVTQLEGGGGR